MSDLCHSSVDGGVSEASFMESAADIQEQAARWVTRVDSDRFTAEQRAELAEWLIADPRHRASYVALQRVWKGLDRLAAFRGREPWLENRREPFPRRGRRWLMLSGVLGALSALAVTALLLWQALRAPVWVTYRTGLGALQEVMLADGTHVVLNTNTEVQAQITGSRRNVQMVRGEALFKVAHDKRTFEVRVGNYVLRDLGTEFSVRLWKEPRLDVLVRQGRVEVDQLTSGPDSRVVSMTLLTQLGAGESLTLRAGTGRISQLVPAEVDRRLAWTTGHLVFAGESVADAFAEFNRYNMRQLIVVDPDIAGLHIGGDFLTTQPVSFITALERTYALRGRVAKDSGNVTLVRRDAH
jgi:transmembrane sensor